MRSAFGWDLPAGVTQSMIDGPNTDIGYCEVCNCDLEVDDEPTRCQLHRDFDQDPVTGQWCDAGTKIRRPAECGSCRFVYDLDNPDWTTAEVEEDEDGLYCTCGTRLVLKPRRRLA